MNPKFLFYNFLALLTCIALMQFTFEPITKQALPHWAYHFLFVFLLFTNITGAMILDGKMKSKPKDFVNVFMLISTFRLLFSILLVVGLIIYAGSLAKYLAVYFVTGYMIFLALEVVFLFKRSKE